MLIIVIYMLIFLHFRPQYYDLEKDKIGGQLIVVKNVEREPDV